ncbi:glycosyltransferase family 2 protein [Luedemannella helvata]|uniref:Glycosyltransferase n=1 Tax=Luedemannella helvata TaxID=349315 RepID=A0ABN2K340_9ACTN
MDAEQITVVVVTRDRCARLRQCLARLLALPERPAVVVVDNGSTDNTAAMVRLRFPSVELVALPANRGAVARNIGVLRARTPVVAFADDDSAWEPGALSRAAALMAAHPRLGLIAARTLVGPQRRLDDVSQVMAGSPLGRAPDLPGPSVLGFLACATVVRRDAFLQAGGFDPVVFFMGEEERVAYDLARRGWGLAYCAEVVALHDPGRPPDPARAALAARNKVLTSWMRRPWAVALAETSSFVALAVRSGPHRRAALSLARRLPGALIRRLPPAPLVEAQLRALARPPVAAPAFAARAPAAR